MAYFRDTYDESRNGWDIITEEAEHWARAIWWEYGAFRDHWGNPNAEIVGYVNRFAVAGLSERAGDLNAYAAKYLEEQCDRKEMHEMLCYVRWTNTLPADRYAAVRDAMGEFIGNCVIRRDRDHNGYGCYPLTLVDSPTSPYYSEYEDVIPAELDMLIDEQGEDGAWHPNWTWGRFEEHWAVALEEWKGVMTLNALRVLRNFGRL